MAESLHIKLGTSACLQWLCHWASFFYSCQDYVPFLSNGPFKTMDEILSAKYLKTIEARALKFEE